MASVTVMVYFAVPIDQARESELLDLPWTRVRKSIRGVAATTPGVVGFHPRHAFTVGPDAGVVSGLERANRAALGESDALVALLPAGVPSVGVPREIEAALAAGKPVAVLTDAHGSFALHDVARFPVSLPGLRAAIEYVRDEALTAVQAAPVASDAIFIHPMSDDARMPSRAFTMDAGFDLYASREALIAPGRFVDVHTDIRIAIPPTMWGRIVGRSSTFRKRRLLVLEGVIDAGYRGPIFTGVTNLSDDPVYVEAGERIAQFIPHTNVALETTLHEVDRRTFESLLHDGRGEAGFGSSGT